MGPERRKNRGPGRPSLQEVLARVDEEVRLLHHHLGGLPRAVEADHILREIWIDDVHNSTAIEGNTMTRAQVEVRDGRLWLSSRAWLLEYTSNRDPRGGQPGERRIGD